MPSVKCYQNRKLEITNLRDKLDEAYTEITNLRFLKDKAGDEFRVALQTRDSEISRLTKDLQIARSQRDVDIAFSDIIHRSDNKFIDALSSKVAELERKIRIYRDYIRRGQPELTKAEQEASILLVIQENRVITFLLLNRHPV